MAAMSFDETGSGNRITKTATMTSMRTGYPDVELVLWDFHANCGW
jgi:hypothetical protein